MPYAVSSSAPREARVPLFSEKVNMATPVVMRRASRYSSKPYVFLLTKMPTSMTGMILQLLESTCVGKLMNLRASYCAQDETLLEMDEGAYT